MWEGNGKNIYTPCLPSLNCTDVKNRNTQQEQYSCSVHWRSCLAMIFCACCDQNPSLIVQVCSFLLNSHLLKAMVEPNTSYWVKLAGKTMNTGSTDSPVWKEKIVAQILRTNIAQIHLLSMLFQVSVNLGMSRFSFGSILAWRVIWNARPSRCGDGSSSPGRGRPAQQSRKLVFEFHLFAFPSFCWAQHFCSA